MDDREQQHPERAYKIWEDEGRPEGAHEDHWRRCEKEHDLAEQQSEDVTRANQEADKELAKGAAVPDSALDARPPSTVNPD